MSKSNKKSSKYQKSTVADMLNILNYDPLIRLVEIAADGTADMKLQYEANKELLSYLVAKPKKLEFQLVDSESEMKKKMLDKINKLIDEHRRDY